MSTDLHFLLLWESSCVLIVYTCVLFSWFDAPVVWSSSPSFVCLTCTYRADRADPDVSFCLISHAFASTLAYRFGFVCLFWTYDVSQTLCFGNLQKWQSPEMAISRNGNLQKLQSPEMAISRNLRICKIERADRAVPAAPLSTPSPVLMFSLCFHICLTWRDVTWRRDNIYIYIYIYIYICLSHVHVPSRPRRSGRDVSVDFTCICLYFGLPIWICMFFFVKTYDVSEILCFGNLQKL